MCGGRILYHIWEFQSTLPARGATRFRCIYFDDFDISIHAPRTGSDNLSLNRMSAESNFNPRSPHGERPLCRDDWKKLYVFQSTLPARGATVTEVDMQIILEISIHAPRTGSDRGAVCNNILCRYFNPRSPHGERRQPHGANAPQFGISIHAPRTGSDTAAQRCGGRP